MCLYQMDFFTSSQVGLPRTIKDSQCDTRPPALSYTDDLGLECDEMLQRSMVDSTPLSHVIQRNAIIKIAAEIYDATESGPISSTVTAELGAKLERTVDVIPAQFKCGYPMSSIAEAPFVTLNRIFLDILKNKATYLLHRRAFLKGSVEKENAKSIDICVEAGLAILEHQRTIIEETHPGRLFFSIRWKAVSALKHESLQATMILYFAFNRLSQVPDTVENSRVPQQQGELLEALTLAKSLRDRTANQSLEARKASKVIAAVLAQDWHEFSLSTSGTSSRVTPCVLQW